MNTLNFSNESIARLRNAIKRSMSGKRYQHTLNVERAARKIAEYVLPSRVSEVCVAALLHDITKEYSEAEQRAILSRTEGITEEDLRTPPAYHSFSAPVAVMEQYSEYATSDVLSAVKNHTLGYVDMTLFDEIVFVADYVSEDRMHPSCISVRNALYDELKSALGDKQIQCALHAAALQALENTVLYLKNRGAFIHPTSIAARDYFLFAKSKQ